MTDTTGTIALYADSQGCIMLVEDTGAYVGCRPELNVRKVARVEAWQRARISGLYVVDELAAAEINRRFSLT